MQENEDIKITYLPLPNGERLVSWHRHDYKVVDLKEGHFMIDGGQDGYYRFSVPTGSTIKPVSEKLEDVFDWVREEFTWTSIVDANKKRLIKPVTKKLKELDTDHIKVLVHYTLDTYMSHLFNLELKYRENESNNSRG